MFMSDADYRRELALGDDLSISPGLDNSQLQPASIDLRLGREFVLFSTGGGILDVKDPYVNESSTRRYKGENLLLRSGDFALATTEETVTLGNRILARVEGRSSLGRLGLAVHITAGFIDPGFSGKITLELFNHNPNAIRLYAGMRICQIVFAYVQTPCLRGYDGKYQSQKTVEPSRLSADFGT